MCYPKNLFYYLFFNKNDAEFETLFCTLKIKINFKNIKKYWAKTKFGGI